VKAERIVNLGNIMQATRRGVLKMAVVEKIKIGIIGFGNVGQYAYLGAEEQKDMEVRGIFVRDVQKYKEKYMQSYPKACDLMYPLTEIPSLKEELDVCLLCTLSRSVPETTFSLLKLGINTVDAYDIHTTIWEYKEKATSIAKENNSVAIISAGWDPGTDSVIRFLMELLAPNGIHKLWAWNEYGTQYSVKSI